MWIHNFGTLGCHIEPQTAGIPTIESSEGSVVLQVRNDEDVSYTLFGFHLKQGREFQVSQYGLLAQLPH